MTKLHRKSENIIINSGIPYTFLRPNFLMQNFSETGTIKKSNSISILSDKGKISFIDVRDVAAVAAEALTKEDHYGKAYDLTGAEALSVDQIVDIFSRMLGRQIIATKFSESEARKLLIAAGFSDWYLDILPEIAEAQEKGFMSIISNDVEKVIGRKPISFANFVKDYINIF